MKFIIRIYRVGSSKEPAYEGEFVGSLVDAQAHTGDMWNLVTPADGTGWRATLRQVGQRRICGSIGW